MVNRNKQKIRHASLLLPWYVTHKLSRRDKKTVEDALNISPELQQELKQQKQLARLIREEPDVLDIMAITTQEQRLNSLLERINQQDSARKKPYLFISHTLNALKNNLASLFNFSNMGWPHVTFALLFIVSQIAILTMVYYKVPAETSSGKYELVTDTSYEPSDKTILMLHFTPQAQQKEINQLFAELGVEKIEHPEGSSHYKVTLSRSLHEKEVDHLINQLEKKTDFIQLIGKGL